MYTKFSFLAIIVLTGIELAFAGRVSNSEFLKSAQTYLAEQNLVLKDLPHARVAVLKKSDGTEIFFIRSSDFSSEEGYQGITDLGIIFNEEKEIIKVRVVKSQETPSYVRKIIGSAFLRQFEKQSVVKDQFEAVSGATITSKAIIRTMKKTEQAIKNVLLEMKKGGKK